MVENENDALFLCVSENIFKIKEIGNFNQYVTWKAAKSKKSIDGM